MAGVDEAWKTPTGDRKYNILQICHLEKLSYKLIFAKYAFCKADILK